MRTVFADTFYFLALVGSRDSAHARVLNFVRMYRGRLVTTEWVLTEVGNSLCTPSNRSLFLSTLDTARTDASTTIVPYGAELYAAGLDLYRNRPDKEWSVTDCVSFVVMQRERVAEALTADHHFEQAGFIALLK